MKSKTDGQTNPHSGSDFDDFLKDEGIFDEVHAAARKRALAEHDTLAQLEARAGGGDAKVGLKVLDKLDSHFSNDTDRK